MSGDLLAPERVASLRDRDVRDRTGLFLAEGARAVISAIANGAAIEALFYVRSLLGPAARRVVRDHPSTPSRRITRDELRSLSIRDSPDGLLAIVRQRFAILPARARDHDLWLALERVRSPGNLGTLMRTASAAGARGVILLGDAIDPYDPRVVRASMGALFALSIVRTDHDTLGRWARASRVRVVGTSAEAIRDFRSPPYHRGPHVVMLGSERRGLSKEQLALCDMLVSIPMKRGDSLNVAIAGSLVLYEAFRHRAPIALSRDRPLRRR